MPSGQLENARSRCSLDLRAMAVSWWLSNVQGLDGQFPGAHQSFARYLASILALISHCLDIVLLWPGSHLMGTLENTKFHRCRTASSIAATGLLFALASGMGNFRGALIVIVILYDRLAPVLCFQHYLYCVLSIMSIL